MVQRSSMRAATIAPESVGVAPHLLRGVVAAGEFDRREVEPPGPGAPSTKPLRGGEDARPSAAGGLEDVGPSEEIAGRPQVGVGDDLETAVAVHIQERERPGRMIERGQRLGGEVLRRAKRPREVGAVDGDEVDGAVALEIAHRRMVDRGVSQRVEPFVVVDIVPESIVQ